MYFTFYLLFLYRSLNRHVSWSENLFSVCIIDDSASCFLGKHNSFSCEIVTFNLFGKFHEITQRYPMKLYFGKPRKAILNILWTQNSAFHTKQFRSMRINGYRITTKHVWKNLPKSQSSFFRVWCSIKMFQDVEIQKICFYAINHGNTRVLIYLGIESIYSEFGRIFIVFQLDSVSFKPIWRASNRKNWDHGAAGK